MAASKATVDVAAKLDASKFRPQLEALKADLRAISLTKARVEADAGRASAEVKRLKADLRALDTRVKLEGNSADLQAKIASVKQQIASMSDKKVKLDVDTSQAKAHLRELSAQLALFSANDHSTNVRVNFDQSAITGISTFTAAALALGPALAPLAAFSIGGLAALGPALLAGGAAAGVAAFAFRGVGDALSALANQHAQAGAEAVAQAGAERAAAAGVASAQAGVASARRSAAQGAASAAAAVRQAMQGVANAERENAQASRQAADAVKEAQRGVATAVREAARATRDAAEGVKDAQRGVSDAERAAAKAAQDAARAVVQARQDVRRATEQAAEGVATALRAQEQAEERLADAQRDARDAQEALADARESAQRKLQDYSLNLADAALDERAANLDLADARANLAKVNADPKSTQQDRERAQLALDEQIQRIKELEVRNKQLREDAAAAAKAGVEGSEEVKDARQQEADATKNVADAQRDLRDAAKDVAQAQRDGARAIRDAQQAVKDALAAQAEAAAENQRRIAEAAEALRDALRSQADTEIQNQERIRDARAAVAKARQAQVDTEISNSQRLRAAQQSLAQARAAQSAQAANSAASVANAERQLGVALANQAAASDRVSASQQTLNEKMAALSPAGRDFVRFLYSLGPLLRPLQADAQGGLFAGITRGIRAALPALPVLREAVRGVSAALGDVAARFGEAVGGRGGQSFIAFVGRTAPPLIRQFGEILGNIGQGLFGMARAFMPVTTMLMRGLVNLSAGFARFATGGGFRPLVEYMVRNGPEVASIVGRIVAAVGRLVVAAVPIGTVVLRGLGGLADIINGLPIPVLTGLVGVIGTLVTVIYGLNVAMRIHTFVVTAQAAATMIAATASKAWATAQWLLNAALTANPIGLVVVGLVALAAGLVIAYNKSETFREIVDTAFTTLKAVAATALDWFRGTLVPFFTRSVPAAFQATVTWVRQRWPVILAILTGPIGLAVLAITRHWGSIRTAFTNARDWVVNNFKRGWAVVQGVIESPIDGARTFISNMFGNGGRVRELFNSVKDWATGTWRNGWSAVEDAIRNPIDGARTFISNMFGNDGRLRELFNGIKDWASTTWKTAWDRVEGIITSPFGVALAAIRTLFGEGGPFRTAFRNGVDAIGTIWDELKAKAARPVRFIVDTVYMGGIRKVVNAIPGIKDPLPPLRFDGFAKGGVLPGFTPGRDVHQFYSPTGGGLALSGGEAIMRPEWTRAVGGAKAVEQMNAAARRGVLDPMSDRIPGFAGGGIWKPVAGGSWGGLHGSPPAIDIGIGVGNPVRAARPGRVDISTDLRGHEPRAPHGGLGYRSYGRYVVINSDGVKTLYAHLSRRAVSAGAAVSGGQQIGQSGDTGNSRGPHLHFGASDGPVKYMTGGSGGGGGGGGAVGAIRDAGRWVTDIVKHLNPLRFLDLDEWKNRLGEMGAWGGMAADMVGNVGGQFRDWAAGKISDAFSGAKGILSGGDFFTTEDRHFVGGAPGAGASGPPQAGNASSGAGGLTAIMEAARQYVQGRWGPMRIGGYNPRNIAGTSTPSDHSFGKALDLHGGGTMQAMANCFATGPGHGRFNIENTIYNRRIHNARGWHAYSGANPHTDHVHIDTFDRGGIARGSGAFVKDTVRPERVLPPRETVVYEELLQELKARRTSGGRLAPLIGSAVIRETVDLERYEREQAFRERMANVGG